jgi:hypothetical protein
LKKNRHAKHPVNRSSAILSLFKIWRPVFFLRDNKMSRYFEGWYFKNVSSGSEHIWSVIPGISIEDRTHTHVFIQLINGKAKELMRLINSPSSIKAYMELLKELKCTLPEVGNKLRERVWKGKSPRDILEELDAD